MVGLSLWFVDANASPNQTMHEGKFVAMQNVTLCTTKEAALEVAKVHKTNGEQAAIVKFQATKGCSLAHMAWGTVGNRVYDGAVSVVEIRGGKAVAFYVLSKLPWEPGKSI